MSPSVASSSGGILFGSSEVPGKGTAGITLPAQDFFGD